MVYISTYKKFEFIKTKKIEKLIIQVDFIECSNLFEGISYKIKIIRNNKTQYKYFKFNKTKALEYFYNIITKYN